MLSVVSPDRATHLDASLTLLASTCQPSDPSSNTGSDSQPESPSGWSARVDWLTLLWDGKANMVESACDSYFGVKMDWVEPVPRRIGILWHRTWDMQGGVLVCERDGEDGRIHSRISLSGNVCGSVSALKMRGFCLWANNSLPHLRVSRIDMAVDDYQRRLEPKQICEALSSESYAGFKKSKLVVEHGDWGGWTIYLGKRGGSKVTRIYDKYAESKGKYNCIRWETELSDELALQAFQIYLACPFDDEELQRLIGDIAIGQVRFIQKVDKNLSRCPLLDWWADFISYLQASPLKLAVTRLKSSVEAKVAWVTRSVSKSLAVLADALGSGQFDGWLSDAMRSARERYTRADENVISRWRCRDDWDCSYSN